MKCFSQIYAERTLECVMITGRTAEITDDLKEKFRQFSLDTGILEENIAILPANGTVLRF